MPAKYKVTVWKTEVYNTEVEVTAKNRDEAAKIAQAEACNFEENDWEYIDSEIEADTPLYGVSDD